MAFKPSLHRFFSLTISLVLIFGILLTGCTTEIGSPGEMPVLSPSAVSTTFEDETSIPAISQTAAHAAETTHTVTVTTQNLNTPGTPAATITPTSIPTEERFDIPLYCLQDGCLYNANQVLMRPVPPGFNRDLAATYRYGSTQYGSRPSHSGVEFINPEGTPVLAAEKGIVVFAGSDEEIAVSRVRDTYGNVVILEHDLPGLQQPVFTLYGHLSAIHVKTGDTVTQGYQIGLVGNTGTAVGSHLHFEVRLGENDYQHTSNPELWLEPNIDPAQEETNGTLIVRLDYKEATLYSLEISIQDFTDPDAAYHPIIYAETYSNRAVADPFWNENLVIGALSPGTYRVSFSRNDRSYKKFIQIEPDKITLVEFEIDY